MNKKVVAYYPIHYGVEWLYWSLRSIHEYVDELVILYSPKPSHGHSSSLANPETYDDIMNVIVAFTNAHNLEDKIHVHHYYGNNHEGNLRDHATKLCVETYGADVVMACDADEIWEPEHIRRAIKHININDRRIWRVPFKHYWRSLNLVCNDPACPHRFTDFTATNVVDEGYIPVTFGVVNHFGYAQSVELVEYKMSIHGHKAEIRPKWFETIFLDESRMFDLHPTNFGFWNAAYSAPSQELLNILRDHPYLGLKLIEHKYVLKTYRRNYNYIPEQ